MENLQAKIEAEDTTGILEALDKVGDRLDPEVVQLLQQLAGGSSGAPAPPNAVPAGGLGRGPFPEGASNQAVGGGRGLGTAKSPRPGMETLEPPSTGTEPQF